MQPLHVHNAGGGWVEKAGKGRMRMCIPPGPDRSYRVAQLDDYMDLPRNRFLWRPPLTIGLLARVCRPELPGTWGFGLWNDPFTATMGREGLAWRLPALPNTAWFFYASPSNSLSLRDDLPAQGFLAATFRSPRLPAYLLAPGLLGLPLLLLRPGRRLLRRWLRFLIRQDTAQLDVDVTTTHAYKLEWHTGQARFWVDDAMVFETRVSPQGPLGFVLWIDNQYAAFTPDGRLGFGTLAMTTGAWLEVEEIRMDGMARDPV